jgi:hypothetical protein
MKITAKELRQCANWVLNWSEDDSHDLISLPSWAGDFHVLSIQENGIEKNPKLHVSIWAKAMASALYSEAALRE